MTALMKYKVRIATVLCLLIVIGVNRASAQSNISLQYSMSMPLGNTSDFIGATSFRGATLDYRHRITPNVGVGFSTGWYSFYEKHDRGTYTSSDGTLSANGILYRYVNSVPVYVMGDYYFNPEKNLSPFIGVGVGITYNRLDNEIGLLRIQQDAWQFSVAPEAGIRIGIRHELSGLVSLRYNNSFDASDVDGQSYLSLNLGLMFGTY